MKKLFLALSLMTLICLHVSAARRPGWVDTMPVAPNLFQGVGVADDTGSKEEDRLRADQNARTEIIQEISSTISSEVVSYFSETSASGVFNAAQSMEFFSSLSSAYADATIEGIIIADRYYDKKTKVHYTYATLLRSQFEEQMTRQAAEARKLARERYLYAQEALSTLNISSALNHLSQALGHVMVAQSVVKQHIEGDLNGDGKQIYLDAALSQALTNIMAQIKITKISGDGQKGERNQGLPEALEGRVIYTDGDREIPLPNIAISQTVDGAVADYNPVLSTNDEGLYQGRIHTLHSATIANPVVRMNLYLPNIDLWLHHSGSESGELFPLGAEFEFQMDVAASVRIFVRILEEVNGDVLPRSQSDGILIKALISKKYKVIDARQLAGKIATTELDGFVLYDAFDSLADVLIDVADYAIVGIIASETSSTGTLNYARANADLKAIELSSGRIIASGVQENVKAAGNTEKKANTSALRKCSQSAIAELLAQLDTALN